MDVASARPCRLTIYGYTDPRGNLRANQALSLRRAVAVRNHLIETGFPESRIVAVGGLGPEPPGSVREAQTEADREQDRRVVVSIVR